MSGASERIVWCDAILSDDGLYRYRLTRRWGDAGAPRICWVMLNPSTADATEDDPTIRRCIGFSKAWGFGSLVVVNLFAFRATNPADLGDAAGAGVDPVGPDNASHVAACVAESKVVVAAWGAGAIKAGPASLVRAVRLAIDALGNREVVCLGLTKAGHPKHPLYVPGVTSPTPFPRPTPEPQP